MREAETMRGRAGLERDLLDAVARRGATLLVGAHGSGRSTLLAVVAASSGGPVGVGLRLLADEPQGIIRHALRTGDPLDPAAVAASLGTAPLLLDDLQWADDASLDLLDQLLGQVPVLATLAAEHPDADRLLGRLGDRVERVDLAPLGDEDARALLAGQGVAPDAIDQRLAWAGGNLGLLTAAPGTELPPPAAWALANRLTEAGEEAAKVVAALALAGGRAPVAALDRGGLEALSTRHLVDLVDGEARLRQGALGPVALAGLTDEERAATRRRLAAAVPPAVAAPLLEAAGDPVAAVAAAQEGLEGADPVRRAELLELVVRCGGGDGGASRRLAEALLAAGRPSDAVGPATDADALDVLVAAHRQAGRPRTSLLVLGAASPPGPAGLTAELYRLRAWPGGHEVDTATTPWLGDGAEGHGSAGGQTGGADALDWEGVASAGASEVGRRLADGGVAEAVEAAAALVASLRSAPNGPWTRTAAVLGAVTRLHGGAGPAALEADLAPLVDGDHPIPGVAAAHLALAVADGGRASDALALLDGAAAGERAPLGGDAVALLWARAEVELVAGRPRRARRALASMDLRLDLPDRPAWVAVAAVAAAWADHDAGSEIEPPAEPIGGAAAHELAGLAGLARDEAAEAAVAFETAAGAWGSRRAVLRCRWAAAEARRRSGALDDAVALLHVLEVEATRDGLLPLLARVRQSLRRAGIRATAAATAAGSGGLSGREAEVMGLVAEGLPSAEIARRLGIGRSTVETQVASAMRKLGARTRRQAAALHLQGSTS